MPHQIIEQPDDVELARVFFRLPSEKKSFNLLMPTDFNRRRMPRSPDWKESGISMFRLDKISKEEARARVPSKKLTGLATTSAQVLQQLGYVLVWTEDNPEHVSVRCPGCNRNLNTLCFRTKNYVVWTSLVRCHSLQC